MLGEDQLLEKSRSMAFVFLQLLISNLLNRLNSKNGLSKATESDFEEILISGLKLPSFLDM